MGRPEEKRPHWGPRCRWEDDIEMDIKDMDCIILAQDREQCRDVVNTITNLRVTQNAGNYRPTVPVLRPSQRCSKRFGSYEMWRYVPDVSRIHVNYIFKCWVVKLQIPLVYHAPCPSADGLSGHSLADSHSLYWNTYVRTPYRNANKQQPRANL